MRYSNIAALILLTSNTMSSVLADEHRQHGAHEHGGGQLNLAIERNTLMIDLSMPAMNIVGFEHPANNDKEHDQVQRAAELLRDGLRLFAPSPAAKCTLIQVEVESALLERDGHHGHENAHDEDDHEHVDFDVAYEFNCANPSQLDTLTLSLFKQFPATEHLDVQAITPAGQLGEELSGGNNVLKLK